MAFTPRSGRSQTRYSTPEPDLDDHRFQPESLPIATDPPIGGRRGTLASLADGETLERPKLVFPTMGHHASIARDFENAIVDDDKSIRSQRSNRSTKSHLSADEEWHRERRGSGGTPIAARRSTFRRAIHNRQREGGVISRESSRSRRSSSPPNSVDAFAPPKRGRSGTVNSKAAASAENLSLHRTISNATAAHRRRGTVVEDGAVVVGPNADAGSVHEDVCFPPEEPPNTYTIDFEDLEEFVAQAHTKTAVQHPFTPHFDIGATDEKRIFQDLRDKCDTDYFPDVEKGGASSSDSANDLAKDTLEPGNVDLTARRPSAAKFEMQNRWTFFSSEIDETIHASELGGLLMPGETFRDIFELGPEGGVWWLDMLNPTEEEIFAVCGAFRVHPLTREDITTQEAREKVELFKSYYFLCFRSFYALDVNSENYLEPINIYAVVFREGLLTFSFCPNPHAANVRKRIGRLRDYVNLSADWICYALIDEIVDSFGPVLTNVEHECDTIEDQVFTARFEDSRAVLKQIGSCRKKVISLIRLLGGKADVIKGFAKKCNEAYAVAPRGDVGLYLSDVQDHIVTMMSNLSHFDKMLSRSHSNHLTQITLSHTEQGSRANNLLGKITIFATILVPLNLIAGLFGMNVPVPGADSGTLAWWFGIVGVILSITICCVIAAKKFKYV